MITKNKYKKTIDLKEIIAKEYIESKKSEFKKIFEFFIKTIIFVGIVFYISFSFNSWNSFISISKTNANESKQMSIRDNIRLERLEVCQEAYKKSGIKQQFIYEQLPVVRCATYMGLIYAYESNFGKSRKCVQDKNCHGMKGNGYDTPKGFLKFKTFKEGREYFAKKYFRFHYKKKINQFVNNWSMTDRKTYKNFMWNNYSKMYGELEYFYLTGRNK